MGELRDRMVMAMQLRNFSAKTIKSYLCMVKGFVRMFDKSPAEMGEEEVRRYLHSLVERNLSWGTVRLAYSALKFLYAQTLEREWTVERLPRPKRETRQADFRCFKQREASNGSDDMLFCRLARQRSSALEGE
jgi:integrase/recombinase XerD